jgi:hypothetical protein
VSAVKAVDLSIIIPAFDEAQRLPKTLACLIAWLEAQPKPFSWEVLVCDDGSTDGTLSARGCSRRAARSGSCATRTTRCL